MDALSIDRCDVYGFHTGASIAVELALSAPGRVNKVMLDGIGLFSEAERESYLAHYALPMRPDMIGSQFLRAFMFCRDQYLFWPWFKTKAKNRRDGGLPSAESLHDWALEVCKALTTYHLSYQAALRHRPEALLPRLTHKTLLIVADNDPLLEHTRQAAKLLRQGQLLVLGHSASSDYTETVGAVIESFLDGPRASAMNLENDISNCDGLPYNSI